jgi:hypothetical protein
MSNELSSSFLWDEDVPLDFDSHGLLQQPAHEEFEHNFNLMSGNVNQDFVGRPQEVSADQAPDGLSCGNGLSNGNDREEGEGVPWWQEVPVACVAPKLAGNTNWLMVSTDVDCSPTYLELGVIKVKQLLEGGHNKSTDDWHPTSR